MDAAQRRAAEHPGWAGMPPAPPRRAGGTAGTRAHWPRPGDTARDDIPEGEELPASGNGASAGARA